MRTAFFLRIASGFSLFLAAGHTLGGLRSWSPIGESEVLRAMRTFRFEVERVSRTYLDFYRGIGFLLSVYLLLQAVVLWQAATLAKTNPLAARPMILSFLLASVVNGILTWIFILPVPTLVTAVITACLGLALFASR